MTTLTQLPEIVNVQRQLARIAEFVADCEAAIQAGNAFALADALESEMRPDGTISLGFLNPITSDWLEETLEDEPELDTIDIDEYMLAGLPDTGYQAAGEPGSEMVAGVAY